MKKKRILLISNMYPTSEYPAYGIFVKKFIKHLSPYFNFRKVVIRGRKRTKLQKVHAYLLFAQSIVKLVFLEKYDYLYVHYVGNTGAILYPLHPFLKGKLVLNFHGSDLIGNFSIVERIMFYFSKQLAAKADLVVVPSPFFKQKARQRLQIDTKKIYVYPSGGIDLDYFKPLDKMKVKAHFGFRQEDFVVGMVSSIYSQKGWEVFLDAVRSLRINVTHLKVLIAGYGIEKEALLKRIEAYDLEEVVFFLGECTHQKLVQVYNAMDIFVFPTLLEESLGLVGLEAMACGVPVVGSRIGALVDYICPGYNGYLFPPGDAVRLQKLLYHFYLERANLSANARETAHEYESKRVNTALAKTLHQL
jgi:glycosyltransferase involved in cell wall biosynthesis